MSASIPEFVATATEKAANDLLAAFHRLPEDQRHWKPLDKGRSAADQMAECAVLNLYTANLIETHEWSVDNSNNFERDKAAIVQDPEKLEAALHENTATLLRTIRAVPLDQLPIEIRLPWATNTLSQIIAYALWNMSYHEGQINYIHFLGE